MTPLRILHLTDLYDPSIGGMEIHVRELCRERVRRGFEVSIVTLSTTGEASVETDEAGVTIYRIVGGFSRLGVGLESKSKPFHPPVPDPVVSHAIRKIIDQVKPDLVHAHNWMVYSYLAIKHPADPPVVLMLHDPSFACPKKSAMFEPGGTICDDPALTKCLGCSSHQYGKAKGAAITLGLRASNTTLHRRIDRVMANSSFTADFTALGLKTNRPIDVVYGFGRHDLEGVATRAPRQDYLPEDDSFILFAGALGAHKGIYDLIEAYEQLGESRPPLVILGAPKPDQPASWPEGVIVREKVPHDEVMAAWKRCRFGVVPSRWAEPLGQVAVEAGALGKAVVATNAGGLKDVIHDDVNGLLVAPGAPQELASAMRRLNEDDALRDRLGAAGVEMSKRFRVGPICDVLDRIAYEVVAERADANRGSRRTPDSANA